MAKSDSAERPPKNPEVRFDESRNLVVVSGTTDQILTVYKALLSNRYGDKSPAVIARDVEMARGMVGADFNDAYQHTFGVELRVRIFTDRFGDYGKRNKVIMTYAPNSPLDEREEQESLKRIKDEMAAIGYKL